MDKENFAKQFGKNIAKYRQNLGLTQEQLAEKINLGNEAISRIERGVTLPSLMRVLDFAEIFQCSIADLLTIKSTKKDDIEHIAFLLQDLSEKDRFFTIKILEECINHLKTKS
ncbi:MAG: helix-turn-helix domain-containing protein [Lonepinella koalarum]|nr:helix-turn-helix domain-containing protein [Lonepinella koalarum]